MQTRFILIEPSHAGNVGAVARAMKTMGFDDLVLVRPRWSNVLRRLETIQRASGALDVLERCRIVENFAEAVAGVHYLCATAMTPRDFGPPTLAPRRCFEQLTQEPRAADFCLGLVFGNERFGMKNDDVYQCHVALQIPTNPQFGSLNLASAVQVIAYEWRLALGDYAEPVATRTALADAQAVQGLLTHWQAALEHLRFLDPASPKKLMPRLHTILNRAALGEEEIHILRGIAKRVLQTPQK